MESLKVKLENLKTICRQRPLIVWGLIAAGTLAAALYREGTLASENDKSQTPDVEAVDTFIPAGFVLVPIEVVNYESLDSVLGRYGVVDLFKTDPQTGERSEKVAARVRILRAPRNPSQFAVLAPESQSQRLVKHGGGFYVVIQNPKQTGTTFEMKMNPQSKKRKRRIEVELGDG